MSDPLPPSPAKPSERKPLSMLWVLAAVGCFAVIHTVINLAYRKPTPPHEPVAEAIERQRKFVQADMKGWTRYAARLTPIAGRGATDDQPIATIERASTPARLAAALPFDLVGIFTTDPKLHRAPVSVAAPTTVSPTDALRVLLHFDAAAKPVAFGEPLAFARDQHLYLFLQDETRTVLDEPPTPFAPALALSLPPNVLSAGEWQVSLHAKDAVFSWRFSIPPPTNSPP